MVLKQATVHTLMLLLLTAILLATAQSLQLVYFGRNGHQLGDNLIYLACRDSRSLSVPNPQIFVERSDLPRQLVTTVNNQGGQVAIVITQDLEGLYSCSDNGEISSNTLELVGKKSYP